MAGTKLKSGHQPSRRFKAGWRVAQALGLLSGVLIIFFLLFYPPVGIHLFWDILIPLAPALLVLAPGVWRNICPMASTSLLPRYLGLSKRKKIKTSHTGKLNLIAVVALYIIVPLRHAVFDKNGLATALLLLSVGLFAVIAGLFFEWKSAWCSGLCPIHSVEKLYGMNNRLVLPNIHCDKCHRCVIPCPDSTPNINPLSIKKTNYHQIAGVLMVGAFPGFVWGWFQVPDYNGINGLSQLFGIYMYPLAGALVTGLLFFMLTKFFQEKKLIPIFAASAVSCYYWFRLPALLGYGVFPGDGMLIDLTGLIPEWSAILTSVAAAFFFFVWIAFRRKSKISWVLRPNYAEK
jgi:hypothetical protein